VRTTAEVSKPPTTAVCPSRHERRVCATLPPFPSWAVAMASAAIGDIAWELPPSLHPPVLREAIDGRAARAERCAARQCPADREWLPK
jgi:hypothetical protein